MIFFVRHIRLLDIVWANSLDTPKRAKWNMAKQPTGNETMLIIVNKPNDRAHTIMTNRLRYAPFNRKSLMPTHAARLRTHRVRFDWLGERFLLPTNIWQHRQIAEATTYQFNSFTRFLLCHLPISLRSAVEQTYKSHRHRRDSDASAFNTNNAFICGFWKATPNQTALRNVIRALTDKHEWEW